MKSNATFNDWSAPKDETYGLIPDPRAIRYSLIKNTTVCNRVGWQTFFIPWKE